MSGYPGENILFLPGQGMASRLLLTMKSPFR